MDFKFLIQRIKNIILDPDGTWDTIITENRPVRRVNANFLLPLITLVALAAFTGSLLFTTTGISKAYFVLTGIRYFLLLYITIFGSAYLFTLVTRYLKLPADFNNSLRLMILSSAPLLLCQIVSRLFETFIFINVLSLYGLYIFWIGILKLMNPPENRKLLLIGSGVAIFIFLYFSVNWLLTIVFDKIYFEIFA